MKGRDWVDKMKAKDGSKDRMKGREWVDNMETKDEGAEAGWQEKGG